MVVTTRILMDRSLRTMMQRITLMGIHPSVVVLNRAVAQSLIMELD